MEVDPEGAGGYTLSLKVKASALSSSKEKRALAFKNEVGHFCRPRGVST